MATPFLERTLRLISRLLPEKLKPNRLIRQNREEKEVRRNYEVLKSLKLCVSDYNSDETLLCALGKNPDSLIEGLSLSYLHDESLPEKEMLKEVRKALRDVLNLEQFDAKKVKVMQLEIVHILESLSKRGVSISFESAPIVSIAPAADLDCIIDPPKAFRETQDDELISIMKMKLADLKSLAIVHQPKTDGGAQVFDKREADFLKNSLGMEVEYKRCDRVEDNNPQWNFGFGAAAMIVETLKDKKNDDVAQALYLLEQRGVKINFTNKALQELAQKLTTQGEEQFNTRAGVQPRLAEKVVNLGRVTTKDDEVWF